MAFKLPQNFEADVQFDNYEVTYYQLKKTGKYS